MGGQPALEEIDDPRLVLDHEDQARHRAKSFLIDFSLIIDAVGVKLSTCEGGSCWAAGSTGTSS
jgi:hypothetical protein